METSRISTGLWFELELELANRYCVFFLGGASQTEDNLQVVVSYTVFSVGLKPPTRSGLGDGDFGTFLVMLLFLTCIVLGEGRGWCGNKETLACKAASVSINAILTTNARGEWTEKYENVLLNWQETWSNRSTVHRNTTMNTIWYNLQILTSKSIPKISKKSSSPSWICDLCVNHKMF